MTFQFTTNKEDYDLEYSREMWHALKLMTDENCEIALIYKELCSLRYIPEDRRFLSLSQYIHWKCFGGAGEYFSIEGPNLLKLKEFALNYFG